MSNYYERGAVGVKGRYLLDRLVNRALPSEDCIQWAPFWMHSATLDRARKNSINQLPTTKATIDTSAQGCTRKVDQRKHASTAAMNSEPMPTSNREPFVSSTKCQCAELYGHVGKQESGTGNTSEGGEVKHVDREQDRADTEQ